MKYKGQLIARGQELVMLFVFGGILLGAGALALAGMAPATSSGATGNVTASVLNNASSSVLQFSTQLPTIGVIGGISLLILVLFIGFGAFLMKKK
jgi:hypothetical protein